MKSEIRGESTKPGLASTKEVEGLHCLPPLVAVSGLSQHCSSTFICRPTHFVLSIHT